MIDPKELRLGNLVNVQLNYDEVSYDECEVEQITDKYLHHTLPAGGGTNTEWEKVEPIPITEEWLERLGFRLDSESNWRCAYNQISRIDRLYVQSIFAAYEENNMKIDVVLDPESLKIRRVGIHGFAYSGMSGVSGSPIDLKYVHQLMNLYYSLTGEELTVKEKV